MIKTFYNKRDGDNGVWGFECGNWCAWRHYSTPSKTPWNLTRYTHTDIMRLKSVRTVDEAVIILLKLFNGDYHG